MQEGEFRSLNLCTECAWLCALCVMAGMRISLVSVVWFAVTVRDTSATIVVISTESLVAAVVSGEKCPVSGSSDLWHKLAAESACIDDTLG